eukprot:TRINITY_DN10678_c0_g1_i1.p1 TRINITY_DN10678_c0_g1~~TRINITY_DN10678_c0_g1_i1.p1  ORF type:complete len:486 (+),score=32.56 TRINITY_DN10678_c0_g1_i1:62-1459(+)
MKGEENSNNYWVGVVIIGIIVIFGLVWTFGNANRVTDTTTAVATSNKIESTRGQQVQTQHEHKPQQKRTKHQQQRESYEDRLCNSVGRIPDHYMIPAEVERYLHSKDFTANQASPCMELSQDEIDSTNRSWWQSQKHRVRLSKFVEHGQCGVPEFPKCDPNVVILPKDPSKGYHFDFYLYIPPLLRNQSYAAAHKPAILVHPNSRMGGKEAREMSRKLGVLPTHIQIRYLLQEIRVFSVQLHSPLLLPAFDGTEKLPWSHYLYGNTLSTNITEYTRLDKQLVAMVESSKTYIKEKLDVECHSKFMMLGTSDSGQFTSRMLVLHPDKLLAVAIGFPGTVLTVPAKEYRGNALPFPFGLDGLSTLLDGDFKEFSMEVFNTVPLFAFVGEQEEDDLVWSFPVAARKAARALLGERMVDATARWETLAELFHGVGYNNSHFAVYKSTPHVWSAMQWKDIVNFFLKAIQP